MDSRIATGDLVEVTSTFESHKEPFYYQFEQRMFKDEHHNELQIGTQSSWGAWGRYLQDQYLPDVKIVGWPMGDNRRMNVSSDFTLRYYTLAPKTSSIGLVLGTTTLKVGYSYVDSGIYDEDGYSPGGPVFVQMGVIPAVKLMPYDRRERSAAILPARSLILAPVDSLTLCEVGFGIVKFQS